MIISIIIPLKNQNKYLEECISYCSNLDYPEFEIIILPNEPFELNHSKITIVSAGNTTPPVKRDMAIKFAKGEILAFIDDDAYPRSDWLKNAVRHLQDKDIAAVCGPAVTAQQDSLRQLASGLIYSSIAAGGNYAYRYTPSKKQYVDDYPSCNFIVRKDIMLKLNGFNTRYWPGEDTFLCYKIIRDLKKKIIYDPEVLVWHHRRTVFLPHLRQVINYALHRGYFVKKYPATSFKLSYFLPSLLAVGLVIGGLFSFLIENFRVIYLLAILTYLIVILMVTIQTLFRNKKIDMRLLYFVFWGIILTHLSYGIFFIKGLLAKKMPEE